MGLFNNLSKKQNTGNGLQRVAQDHMFRGGNGLQRVLTGEKKFPPPMQPRPSLTVGGPAYFTPEGYEAPRQPEQAFMPTDTRPDPIGDNFRRPYPDKEERRAVTFPERRIGPPGIQPILPPGMRPTIPERPLPPGPPGRFNMQPDVEAPEEGIPQSPRFGSSAPAGFIPPAAGRPVAFMQVEYYNPTTGETWTAPNAGWTPPEGWEWKRPPANVAEPAPEPEFVPPPVAPPPVVAPPTPPPVVAPPTPPPVVAPTAADRIAASQDQYDQGLDAYAEANDIFRDDSDPNQQFADALGVSLEAYNRHLTDISEQGAGTYSSSDYDWQDEDYVSTFTNPITGETVNAGEFAGPSVTYDPVTGISDATGEQGVVPPFALPKMPPRMPPMMPSLTPSSSKMRMDPNIKRFLK